MEDLLAKLKEIIGKIVELFKKLIAKITGKGEEEETTAA